MSDSPTTPSTSIPEAKCGLRVVRLIDNALHEIGARLGNVEVLLQRLDSDGEPDWSVASHYEPLNGFWDRFRLETAEDLKIKPVSTPATATAPKRPDDLPFTGQNVLRLSDYAEFHVVLVDGGHVLLCRVDGRCEWTTTHDFWKRFDRRVKEEAPATLPQWVQKGLRLLADRRQCAEPVAEPGIIPSKPDMPRIVSKDNEVREAEALAKRVTSDPNWVRQAVYTAEAHFNPDSTSSKDAMSIPSPEVPEPPVVGTVVVHHEGLQLVVVSVQEDHILLLPQNSNTNTVHRVPRADFWTKYKQQRIAPAESARTGAVGTPVLLDENHNVTSEEFTAAEHEATYDGHSSPAEGTGRLGKPPAVEEDPFVASFNKTATDMADALKAAAPKVGDLVVSSAGHLFEVVRVGSNVVVLQPASPYTTVERIEKLVGFWDRYVKAEPLGAPIPLNGEKGPSVGEDWLHRTTGKTYGVTGVTARGVWLAERLSEFAVSNTQFEVLHEVFAKHYVRGSSPSSGISPLMKHHLQTVANKALEIQRLERALDLAKQTLDAYDKEGSQQHRLREAARKKPVVAALIKTMTELEGVGDCVVHVTRPHYDRRQVNGTYRVRIGNKVKTVVWTSITLTPEEINEERPALEAAVKDTKWAFERAVQPASNDVRFMREVLLWVSFSGVAKQVLEHFKTLGVTFDLLPDADSVRSPVLEPVEGASSPDADDAGDEFGNTD